MSHLVDDMIAVMTAATPREVKALAKAHARVPDGNIALTATQAAAERSGRAAARHAAWDAAARGVWPAGISVTKSACLAASALVVIDLVGRCGLEQQHIDALLGPVAQVWPTFGARVRRDGWLIEGAP